MLLWLVVAFLIFLWNWSIEYNIRIFYISGIVGFTQTFPELKDHLKHGLILLSFHLFFFNVDSFSINTIFNTIFPLFSLSSSCLKHVLYLLVLFSIPIKGGLEPAVCQPSLENKAGTPTNNNDGSSNSVFIWKHEHLIMLKMIIYNCHYQVFRAR